MEQKISNNEFEKRANEYVGLGAYTNAQIKDENLIKVDKNGINYFYANRERVELAEKYFESNKLTKDDEYHNAILSIAESLKAIAENTKKVDFNIAVKDIPFQEVNNV